MSTLKGRDIISALDFSREEVEHLFRLAEDLREELRRKRMLDYAKGKVMITVFLEPSTRTRLSFTFAMIRLGGIVVDFGPEQLSSRAKGESFEDTCLLYTSPSPRDRG